MFRMVGVGSSRDLFVRLADGTGAVEQLTSDPDRQPYPRFWSRDDSELWFDDCLQILRVGCNVASLRMSGDHEASIRLHSTSGRGFAGISPDGR